MSVYDISFIPHTYPSFADSVRDVEEVADASEWGYIDYQTALSRYHHPGSVWAAHIVVSKSDECKAMTS